MQDKIPPANSIVFRLIGIVAILLAHFFTFVLVLFALVSVVPRFMRFFEHAEAELSAVTMLLLLLSDIFGSYWYLLVPLMMVDGAIVVWLSILSPKKRWLLSLYSHLWLLCVIFLLFWVSVAMALPFHDLSPGGKEMFLEVNGRVVSQEPDEDIVRDSLSGLDVARDGEGLAILSQDKMTYLQVSGDSQRGFDAEYQEGNVENHFRAKNESFTTEEVISMMTEYQQGSIRWEKYGTWSRIKW